MRTVRGILADLKIESVKLLTNNPRKIKMLQGHGIFIVERLPVLASSSAHSAKYPLTKEGRMGHVMS